MASKKGTLKKRVEVGCRVEGNFGDFIEAAEPNKKRKRGKSFATVVEAAGEKKWMIRLDANGHLRQVGSRSIKVVDDDCGVMSRSFSSPQSNEEEENDSNVTVSNYDFVIDIYCLTLI